jgi:hypothetical protein
MIGVEVISKKDLQESVDYDKQGSRVSTQGFDRGR